MKLQFFDNEFGSEIHMVPETVEEVAALFRMTNNSLAVKPDIQLYLSGKEPSCMVWLRKVKSIKQKNSVSN